jgi:drug/metabolite transporter (DMT)-like permease
LEIFLGITAALCWGVADFSARFASRRLGAYSTLAWMQLFGFIALLPYVARSGSLSRALPLGWHVWGFAVLAGLLNVVSSLALYRSFEIGMMSIVGPVSSAYPALTVTLAFLSGERIAPLRVAGLALTFAGVLLAAISFSKSSASPGAPDSRLDWARGAGWAVVAAIGFGVMFWWLGFHVVPSLGGALSVWVIRLTSLSALMLVAVPARQRVRIPRGNIWWLLAAVGVTDTAAFVANNAGMAIGHVSVVSVISSLYGAITVLLSWIFLRERVGKSQWLGIFLIFAGIVFVSL